MAVSEGADADGGADGIIIESTDIKDTFRKDKHQLAGSLRIEMCRSGAACRHPEWMCMYLL